MIGRSWSDLMWSPVYVGWGRYKLYRIRSLRYTGIRVHVRNVRVWLRIFYLAQAAQTERRYFRLSPYQSSKTPKISVVMDTSSSFEFHWLMMIWRAVCFSYRIRPMKTNEIERIYILIHIGAFSYLGQNYQFYLSHNM